MSFRDSKLGSASLRLNADTQPVFGPGDLGLVNVPPDPTLTVLVTLARQTLGADVVMFSAIEESLDRQFMTAQEGLREPWASSREAPLAYSLCRTVMRRAEPIVVPDVREAEETANKAELAEIGTVAYLGQPVIGLSGECLAVLAAVHRTPRTWTEDEVGRMAGFAVMGGRELMLRAAVRTIRTLRSA